VGEVTSGSEEKVKAISMFETGEEVVTGRGGNPPPFPSPSRN